MLSKYLDRSGLAARLEAVSALTEWDRLVGEKIASVTNPIRVSDSTLIVGVTTSPWLMELNLMKRELLYRLNAGRKKGRIEKLVFVPSPTGYPD
ncbi:MAG: DUF721 domain-containing protein [Longimicrobiaceae bacterium]